MSVGVAIVLGGRGDRAIVWETAVLAGLVEGGVDLRGADVHLGTSAGSIVAARTAAGIDPRDDAEELARSEPSHAPERVRRLVWSAVHDVVDLWQDPARTAVQRRREIGRLALDLVPAFPADDHVGRQAARLPSEAWPPSLSIAAIDIDRGERVVFDPASGLDLPAAVAGARAVPAVAAPVDVGGRRVVDAGVASGTNADLLDETVDLALVLTTADPAREPGSLDAVWNAELETETAILAARGVRTLVVRPSTQAREAIGDDFTGLPDPAGAVEAGWDQGIRTGVLVATF
jgi:NTE family protein